MKIKTINISILEIPFKEKFTHSLKSRTYSNNIIIQINSKTNFGYGECLPRTYVTGETKKSVIKTLKLKIIPHFKKIEFKTKNQLLNTLWKYRQTLKSNELSAFSGFEIAIIHLAAKELDLKIEDIFNYFKIEPTNQNSIQYSAIISDKPLPIMLIKSLIIKHRKFKQIKIKTSQKTLYKLKYIKKILKTQQIRIDANCDFKHENFKNTATQLKKLNIKLLEQPFLPNMKSNQNSYKLAKENNINIILDESLLNFQDLKKLGKTGNILNIRIGKVGGIMSSIYMYKYAQENNYQTILGCLVGETILSKINQILAQKLKLTAIEGNYDKYLFKNPIIDNKPFKKNGTYSNKTLNISYNIKLNNNFKKYLKSSTNY